MRRAVVAGGTLVGVETPTENQQNSFPNWDACHQSKGEGARAVCNGHSKKAEPW